MKSSFAGLLILVGNFHLILLFACLFTTSGSVVSWLLSHSQEKGMHMTKEEKVMFLMRLAVETHSAYRSGHIASGKKLTDHNPIETIEKIYDKYEELLVKKLAE